jgi:hypothetical protein
VGIGVGIGADCGHADKGNAVAKKTSNTIWRYQASMDVEGKIGNP